jgi:hypothetical protein
MVHVSGPLNPGRTSFLRMSGHLVVELTPENKWAVLTLHRPARSADHSSTNTDMKTFHFVFRPTHGKFRTLTFVNRYFPCLCLCRREDWMEFALQQVETWWTSCSGLHRAGSDHRPSEKQRCPYHKRINTKFEALTAVRASNKCGLVGRYQRFGRGCCFHFWGWSRSSSTPLWEHPDILKCPGVLVLHALSEKI